MHSQRTSPPGSSGGRSELDLMRPPNPGDVHDDFITQLRNGDYSDLHTEEDEVIAEEEEAALQSLREDPAEEVVPKEEAPPQEAPRLPAVLQRIFGTDAEEELMAVAHLLDPAARKELTLVFHTDIGDVRCPINWCSMKPSHLHRAQDLLLVMVRSRASMFVPKPGAELEISILDENGRQSPHLGVVCLSGPMQLYPKVGVDLLAFLPQPKEDVEKNGKLAPKAPSVVSGRPSDDIDGAGEPIVHGEKSAAVKALPTASKPRGSEVPSVVVDEKEDFDKPRES